MLPDYCKYSPDDAMDLLPKRMVPNDAPLRVRRGSVTEASPD